MDAPDEASCTAARSRRRRSVYCFGVSPVSERNLRWKSNGDRRASDDNCDSDVSTVSDWRTERNVGRRAGRAGILAKYYSRQPRGN